jgi:hypothetical protein
MAFTREKAIEAIIMVFQSRTDFAAEPDDMYDEDRIFDRIGVEILIWALSALLLPSLSCFLCCLYSAVISFLCSVWHCSYVLNVVYRFSDQDTPKNGSVRANTSVGDSDLAEHRMFDFKGALIKASERAFLVGDIKTHHLHLPKSHNRTRWSIFMLGRSRRT